MGTFYFGIRDDSFLWSVFEQELAPLAVLLTSMSDNFQHIWHTVLAVYEDPL